MEYMSRQQASVALAEIVGRVRRGQATADEALALAEELIELDPENGGRQIAKFDVLLTVADRPDDAYAYGREIAARFPNNYLLLNDLAWNTVSLPDVSRRDLEFALEMSRRANAIQGYIDYSVLDTLARIWWLRGNADEAIRWQLKAVARAYGTWHGDSTRANLDAYTNGYLKPGEMPPPYRSSRRR
jgi:tetratricopeptide (TPR) repeat protein